MDTTNLTFYFQPIYDLRKNCFSKLELLTRFSPQNNQATNTEEIIAQAEHDGNVIEIDLAALEFACTMLPALKQLDIGIETIHVNISPVTCSSPLLFDSIRQILDRTGITPSDICIELTETNFSGSLNFLVQVMETLRQLHFCLALDDVGKGESGFDRMLYLPFTHFKLDKSIALQLHSNERIPALISSLVHFADQNGMTVTAEGVETAQTAAQLYRLGCHYLQGYYYAKPMPYDHLISWLTSTAPLHNGKRAAEALLSAAFNHV